MHALVKRTKRSFYLQTDLVSNNIDFCFNAGLAETFENNCISIPGYFSIRYSHSAGKSDKSSGGGICFFYKSQLAVKKVNLLESNKFKILL